MAKQCGLDLTPVNECNGGTQRPLLLYSSNNQRANLGDIFLHATLLRRLRTFGDLLIDDAQLTEAARSDLKIAEEERGGRYSKRFWLVLLRFALLRRLSVPGVPTYWILPPGHPHTAGVDVSKALALKNVSLLRVLRALGIRICRFGVSVGPLSSNQALIEKTLAEVSWFYSVREDVSRAYLESLGVKKVAAFPDLALIARNNPNEQLDHTAERTDVLLSLREEPHSWSMPANFRERLLETVDAIVDEVCRGVPKRLVVFSQVDQDESFAAELTTRYRGRLGTTVVKLHSLAEAAQSFSSALVVISNRLHALLIGANYGAAPVAPVDAARHWKVVSILQDLKMRESIVDINTDYGTSGLSGLLGRVEASYRSHWDEETRQAEVTATNVFEAVLCQR